MAWTIGQIARLAPGWRNRATRKLRQRAASDLALGRAAEVEADARLVMAAYTRVGPAGEPYLSAWQYLAVALANLGRHTEAAEELTECFDAVLAKLGNRNAVVVGLRISRAGQLAYLARYGQAEADYRAALDDSRHVRPDAMGDRLRFAAVNCQVIVLNLRGLPAEAEALALPAIREAESSAMQSDISVSLRCGLAQSLNAQERYAEAERILAGLRPQDPDRMVSVRLRLATAQLGLGKLAEAEATAQEAVSEGTWAMSPAHYLTLSAGTVLGSALARQGRLDEAQRQLHTNAAAWAEHFGDEHPRTVAARAELAQVNSVGDQAP
jgi:tetratricopeptide (TPR) repeat protein